MDIRGNDKKLLFRWEPKTQTINIVRKNKRYEVCLDKTTYNIVKEEYKHK